MDPGRLRKMFTSLPGVFSVSRYTVYHNVQMYKLSFTQRKAKKPKQQDSTEWQRPEMLHASKYFSPQGGTEVPLSPADPRQ